MAELSLREFNASSPAYRVACTKHHRAMPDSADRCDSCPGLDSTEAEAGADFALNFLSTIHCHGARPAKDRSLSHHVNQRAIYERWELQSVRSIEDNVMAARPLGRLLLGPDHRIDSLLLAVGENIVRRENHRRMSHGVFLVGPDKHRIPSV